MINNIPYPKHHQSFAIHLPYIIYHYARGYGSAISASSPRKYVPSVQSSQSLLVTDMVVKVEDEVPEIVAEDPRPLLFHARDNAKQKVEDTKEVRRKGWRRIVQVILVESCTHPARNMVCSPGKNLHLGHLKG